MSPCGPPSPEAFYSDIDQLYTLIQAFAKPYKYTFAKRNKKAKRVMFIYNRGRLYSFKGKKGHVYPSKQRQSTTKKYNCQMEVMTIVEEGG